MHVATARLAKSSATCSLGKMHALLLNATQLIALDGVDSPPLVLNLTHAAGGVKIATGCPTTKWAGCPVRLCLTQRVRETLTAAGRAWARLE